MLKPRLSPLIHAGIPFLIFSFFLILSGKPDLALHIPALFGYTALITIFLAVAVFLEDKHGIRWSWEFILFFAAGMRFLFFFRNPELSDDIYRYLFDGRMLLSRANPYAEAPLTVITEDPVAASLIPLINHADLPTIYPPAAQMVFAAGAFIGGIFGMKLVLVIMDLMSCTLILRLLKHLRLPYTRAILYAWHPLPVIEISASGHIDAAVIFFLMLSLCAMPYGERICQSCNYRNTRTCRWIAVLASLLAGVCFALSLLSKWIPFLFLPGFFILSGYYIRKFYILGIGITVILLIAPFLPEITNSFTTLFVYLMNWEFSGYAFRTLRQITGSGQTARIILSLCSVTAVCVIYTGLFFHLRSSVFFQKTASSHDYAMPVLQSFYSAAMAWLLLTPTLHPWYALYLTCFLPFIQGFAGLTLSWSVLLAYYVMTPYHLTGQWTENDIMPLLIAAAPVSYRISHHMITGLLSLLKYKYRPVSLPSKD